MEIKRDPDLKRLQIYIPEYLKKDLYKESVETKLPMSRLVEEALILYLGDRGE